MGGDEPRSSILTSPSSNPEAFPSDLRFRRPLVPLAVAYLLGILLADRFAFPLLLLLGLFTAILVLSVFLLLCKGSPLILTGLVLLLFLLLGTARFTSLAGPYPPWHLTRLPEALLREGLILEGVVVAPPEQGGPKEPGRLRLILRVEKIGLFGRSASAEGRARVTILKATKEYHYGDRIRGVFQLRHPRGFLNPGLFDRQRFLAAQGIHLEGWAEDDRSLVVFQGGEGNPVLARIYTLRTHLLSAFDRVFPQGQAALLKAILLGDRSSLSEEMNEAFLRSGTYHILAISGLNVSLLAGALFLALTVLGVPLRIRAFLSLGLVTGYAALAGGSPSVVRAALMTDVYLLALLLEREGDLLNTLALSAFLLLLWNPFFVFEVGFQLTFVATFSILLVVERVPFQGIPRPWRWLLASVLVSSAAFFGTLPILVGTFHRASPIGLLANLPIVPLTGLLTTAGMALGVLLLVFPEGFWPLDLFVGFLVEALLFLAKLFAAFPYGSLTLYPPTPPMIVLYYLLMFGLLSWQARWARGLIPFAVVALSCTVILRLLPLPGRELLSTFLDVGQGDAILVELPCRKTILVDGGGLAYGDFDIGEQVVVPYLRSRWIRRLDLVILSHPHPDHLNGLLAVLKELSVREFWEAGYPAASPFYRALVETAHIKGIHHRVVGAGFGTEVCPGVRVEVLHPTPSFLQSSSRRRSSSVNNSSLVLKLRYKNVAFLLTGDIEEEAEVELLKQRAALQADILKVPHHGGKTSSMWAFLQGVRPKGAVISVGIRNRFGHPHPEALVRYQEIGAKVYRTDQDGAVVLSTDGHRILGRTFREPHWIEIE